MRSTGGTVDAKGQRPASPRPGKVPGKTTAWFEAPDTSPRLLLNSEQMRHCSAVVCGGKRIILFFCKRNVVLACRARREG